MVKAWGQGFFFHFGRVTVTGLENKPFFGCKLTEPSLLVCLLSDGEILDEAFKRINGSVVLADKNSGKDD